MSVAFSPDGKTIAAGYGNGGLGGVVVLWEAVARKRMVGSSQNGKSQLDTCYVKPRCAFFCFGRSLRFGKGCSHFLFEQSAEVVARQFQAQELIRTEAFPLPAPEHPSSSSTAA